MWHLRIRDRVYTHSATLNKIPSHWPTHYHVICNNGSWLNIELVSSKDPWICTVNPVFEQHSSSQVYFNIKSKLVRKNTIPTSPKVSSLHRFYWVWEYITISDIYIKKITYSNSKYPLIWGDFTYLSGKIVQRKQLSITQGFHCRQILLLSILLGPWEDSG